MAVEVVDGGEREPAGGGERLGGGHADQQRADQPGALGDGDELDVVERVARGRSASSTTALTSSRWWREAISGTTPPKRSCTPWLETTFERISPCVGDDRGAGVVAGRLEREDHVPGTSSSVPRRVPGVRHMITASSPLSA